METKGLATFVMVGVLSMLLVTSGLTIALSDNGETTSVPSWLSDGEEETREWEELIGHEEALDIAFEEVNGTGFLTEFELERGDDENHTYEIEIITGEKEYEMEIDAHSGEIREFEMEGLDEDEYEMDWDEIIGHEEALEIAFDRIDDTAWLIEFELEKEEATYEIELISSEQKYELKMDAYTGELSGSEMKREREGEENREKPDWENLTGHEEAIDIAFDHINETGWLVGFELGNDDGTHHYELNIVTSEQEYELKIDAYTGELLEFELEEYDEDESIEWENLIGHETALDTAFEEVNETAWLIEFELEENDEMNETYEIEIMPEEQKYEFKIDAYSAELIEFEGENRERHRRRNRGIGGFWNGTEGTYVSFELREHGIENYTLHTNDTELLLFENITIENFTMEEEKSEKVFYEIEGDGTEIQIFDVAPALMKMEIESEDDRTVTFELGDLRVVGQDGPNLELAYENYTAKLLSVTRGDSWNESLDMSIENRTVSYTFEDELFLVFRMTDCHYREREREREMEENISKGISEGRVGGEVIVDKDGGKFSDISVSYSDMTMETTVRERNRVRVQVSSDTLGEGKVVAVNVNKRVMNIDNAENIEVTFDGKEISMAYDYEDLTTASDRAEYLVSVGADQVQVLVMVPHFSTHTIEIAKTGDDFMADVPNYLPMVLIAVPAIVAMIYVVKKRR